ncbi:MAG: hypothetical protein VX764_03875 [Planctomycetota bacterium]|nr:hypothetical protein [Planctomycetota bacterium]
MTISRIKIWGTIFGLVLVCGLVTAQPGSIVTQSKTTAEIEAGFNAAFDNNVITKNVANQVMNNLVGKWNFEYALSEELGGYPAGTPVRATVVYCRDFTSGGLFGSAETVNLNGAVISNGTYFINWNAAVNRLESHGRFVAGNVISIFDEYLKEIKSNTCCWIGQRYEDGITSSNVLIERTINNGNFNVVVNELSPAGKPLAQLWNVTGVKVNPLKEALGPFVALASAWQSESFSDNGDRLRIEQSGYWAANETCLVVEAKKYKNDIVAESTIQTYYYDFENCRIAFTEIGSNGLVCNGYVSPTTERNGTPCQLRVVDSEFGNGANVSTINKVLLVDSKTIKIDFEWAWWQGEDITTENNVLDFEQRFVLKRVPASSNSVPRPASF